MERFEQRSKDSAAAARVAQSTAPKSEALRKAGRAAQRKRELQRRTGTALRDRTGPTGESVVDRSGAGMDLGFPIVLGLTLLGAVAFALGRRRYGGLPTVTPR